MEKFANSKSDVWRNVDYSDNETKLNIMRETHSRMVKEGNVVVVSDGVRASVAESFPNLREVKKKRGIKKDATLDGDGRGTNARISNDVSSDASSGKSLDGVRYDDENRESYDVSLNTPKGSIAPIVKTVNSKPFRKSYCNTIAATGFYPTYC